MITIDNQKQCGKCKEFKHATNEFFRNDKSAALGLKSQCRQCECENTRKWQEANLDRHKEKNRKWREANPEKAKENSRKWYEANGGRAKEYSRKRYEANPEKAKEYSRKWREANPEKAKEKSRKWRETNPERARESGRKWREENPEKAAAAKQKRRALKANAAGTATAEQIKARFQYYGSRCYYCGDNKPGLHIEHRIPLSRGGSNWPANLVPSCPSCNLSKSTKTEKEFLQIISERGDSEKP